MDPNEALSNARVALRCYRNKQLDESVHVAAAEELAEAFEALDQWITAGGHLPKDWNKEE